MDAERIAARLTALTTVPSRRRLLGALSAFGLGALLIHPDADAKNRRKHKNTKKKAKQKTVTLCLNGQSLVVPKSVALSLLKQGATFGECSAPPSPPPPPPPPPSPPSPPPPPLTCQDLPDGTDCGNGRQCSGGVCATPPTCGVLSEVVTCSTSQECCSGFCFFTCGPSSRGQACRVDGDCTSGNCAGFVCQ